MWFEYFWLSLTIINNLTVIVASEIKKPYEILNGCFPKMQVTSCLNDYKSIFQHDNAFCHRTKRDRAFLLAYEISDMISEQSGFKFNWKFMVNPANKIY